MSELTRELATTQISQRVDEARRARVAVDRRPHGRHALAARLHRFADRLDG
jgi:hypothetical protein